VDETFSGGDALVTVNVSSYDVGNDVVATASERIIVVGGAGDGAPAWVNVFEPCSLAPTPAPRRPRAAVAAARRAWHCSLESLSAALSS
jgi:hypothetical protein